MKKTIVLISLTVLVVLLFVSCAGMDSTGVNTDSTSDTTTVTNTNDESKVEYNVSLGSTDGFLYKLFKKETPLASVNDQREIISDSEYEFKQVGDIQLEMKLKKTAQGGMLDESKYLLKDEATTVTIFDNDANHFSLLSGAKGGELLFLKKYQEDEISEEKLIKHCKDYVAEFVNGIDYSPYTYICYTLFEELEEDYYSELLKEGFYDKIHNENEKKYKPNGYIMSYHFMCGEYFTSNIVRFVTNENGDITLIKCSLSNADWSKYALENEELTKIAKEFLDKYLVEDCKLISYETTPSLIVKTKEESVFVIFYIDITAEYNGEIISGKTEVRITFSDEITDVGVY